VDFFKDWINNQMMTALPNSIIYMDAVSEIETLGQQADGLIDKRRARAQTLARLKAIKTTLDTPTFAEQPKQGSSEEKALISLVKQYNANKDSISSTISIEDTRNELAIAKDKLANLKKLTTECNAERTEPEQGWSVPGGWSSTLNNKGTEKELFCDWPIKGGKDHEMFLHENDNSGSSWGVLSPIKSVVNLGSNLLPTGPVTHPEIPYVNAKNVLHWGRFGGVFGQHKANIELSCKIIFKANVLDYKGNIPGLTPTIDPYEEMPQDIDTSIPDSGPTTEELLIEAIQGNTELLKQLQN